MLKKIRKILVPIDLSPISKEVVGSAVDLAQRSDARLVFLTVVEPRLSFLDRLAGGVPSNLGLLENDMSRAAGRMKKMLGQIKVLHQEEVLAGSPSAQIRKLASRSKADLIMVGSHGKGPLPRLLLGSVSDSVAREATQAVWIVKGRSKRIRKIFVPVDGSEGSLEALETAVRLARLMKAKIQPVSIAEYEYVPPLSYVDPKSYGKDLLERRKKEVARWIKKKVSTAAVMPAMVRLGHAASDLPRLIKKTGSDLVVMSTHARRGLGFTLLGRVAAHMIHRSPCSILLVRPSGWRYRPV
jgi:nucleotide-binding universal stress UspA family protein